MYPKTVSLGDTHQVVPGTTVVSSSGFHGTTIGNKLLNSYELYLYQCNVRIAPVR